MPTSVMCWAEQLERPVFEVMERSQRTSEARFVVDRGAKKTTRPIAANSFGVRLLHSSRA
jgi:hypothetical protein